MTDHFHGYPRPDGSAGTRNYVAVIASVICSTKPVEEIAARVPGAIAVVHPLGCAQVGDDLRQTRRSLTGMAMNPNVEAALIVGLGCENNQPAELAALIDVPKPLDVIGIQALGGSDKVVEAGCRIAGEWAEAARRAPRVELPLAALNLGVLCLEGDGPGAARALQAVGELVDACVAAGARVTVGADAALEPAGQALAARAGDPETAGRLRRWGSGHARLRWQEGHREARRPWSEAERLRAGRLSAMTGSAPIAGVLDYSARAPGGGLYLMEVPADPAQAMSGMVAGGVTLLVVLSGRGLLAGAVGCPTLVVAPEAARGSALAATVDHFVAEEAGGGGGEAGRPLLERVLSVASGEATRLEGAGLAQFAIAQLSTAF